MDLLPRVSVVTGKRVPFAAAPLTKLFERMGTADKTALIYSDETCDVRVSYAELEERTNALARAIATHARPTGPNRDQDYVISVCMQPTHNTLIALLAIWKAGASYVPMEPSFPQTRITHILKDAQPSLIIYDDTANPAMFKESGVPAVSFDELSLEASALPADRLNEDETLVQTDADTIAIVLYTSGSTGIPKGVRLSYSAICNRLWWQFRNFPYADTETVCVWKTALTFVDSVCEIWGPLLHGRSLLILSRETIKDPQKLVQVFAEYKVQRLVLVPTLLRSILMYLSLYSSERPLQHLKLWVCSGETLSKELALQFFRYFGDRSGYKLGNFYGSTEVMGDVTYYVLEKAEQLDMFPTVPIGVPLDNCIVYLLDEEMNPSRESEPGEIWVSGRNLAKGYVGGQGADKFCDNPYAAHPDFGRLYRTGDFGTLHKGVILYEGRTDSQVKIRGHRVDLQEVERAVSAIQDVDKAEVLYYRLESGNAEILAFVTIKSDARLSGNHIEVTLKNSLTNYMIPQVIVLDKFPLLVNGKVDRQGLIKIYDKTNNNDDADIPLEIDYTGVNPCDLEVARVLFETVGEVLGRSVRGALSIRAGFYELGGNSLNTIYTITRLREKGYYIEINDFLRSNNLGEVLSHLKTNPENAREEDEHKFAIQPMRNDHKERVIEMIVSSFCCNIELEEVVNHNPLQLKSHINTICCDEYALHLDACWGQLLAAGLSIVLEDLSGKAMAVALNFDARDEPDIELSGGLARIMGFIKYVEGSVRDTMLPEGKGTILHSFMMATDCQLSPQDKVSAILLLELGTERVARERHFRGIFATNTSPLTQQLATDVLGFKMLLNYQINQYVDSNGERPFGQAPNDLRAIVCWKPID